MHFRVFGTFFCFVSFYKDRGSFKLRCCRWAVVEAELGPESNWMGFYYKSVSTAGTEG